MNTYTVTLTLNLTVTPSAELLDSHVLTQYAAYDAAVAALLAALPDAKLVIPTDIPSLVTPA
jgi:hypothetical protein